MRVCFEDRDQSDYLYRDKEGAWGGAAFDLVQQVFATARIEVQWVPLPWGRCLREAAAYRGQPGEVKVAFDASRSPAWESQFYFSEPLHQVRGGARYAKDRWPQPPTLRRLQDLQAYRLCGMLHHNDEWRQHRGVTVQDAGAPSQHAAMTKLQQERCDLVLSSWEMVRGSVAMGQLAPDPNRVFMAYPEHEPVSQHLLWSRASPRAQELLQRFGAALAAKRREGSANATYQRYFGRSADSDVAAPAAKQRVG